VDSDLRARFNDAWDEALADRMRDDVGHRLKCEIPFRLAETPLFLTKDMVARFSTAADELMALISKPEFIATQERFVPDEAQGPGRGKLPQFAVVDFAIAEEDGKLVPKLVELQGFPSLYGFQIMLAEVWATQLDRMESMPDGWRLFFGGHNRASAMKLLDRALLNGHAPEDVVLLDLDVREQKTYPDFAAIRHWFGIDSVSPADLIRDGNQLFRERGGKRIQVKRIYQRIVFDEWFKKRTVLPFSWNEDLDVEWAPHPAWFFLWSKPALLALDHPSVPKTQLLSEMDTIPDDLSEYVLKPLHSFAGAGVNVDPTRADVDAVENRDDWILQQKVHYAPALKMPDGTGVKAEMRLMFVRPDDSDHLELLLNLVRLSRGKMIGVDHNKDMAWTGASVGIWPDQPLE